MDFRDQVWKRVWEMAFFGLKLGLNLEMRAAHPRQKFQGVPPRGKITWLSFAVTVYGHRFRKLRFENVLRPLRRRQGAVFNGFSFNGTKSVFEKLGFRDG